MNGEAEEAAAGGEQGEETEEAGGCCEARGGGDRAPAGGGGETDTLAVVVVGVQGTHAPVCARCSADQRGGTLRRGTDQAGNKVVAGYETAQARTPKVAACAAAPAAGTDVDDGTGVGGGTAY